MRIVIECPIAWVYERTLFPALYSGHRVLSAASHLTTWLAAGKSSINEVTRSFYHLPMAVGSSLATESLNMSNMKQFAVFGARKLASKDDGRDF